MAEGETRLRLRTQRGNEHFEELRSKFYKRVQTAISHLTQCIEECEVNNDQEHLENTLANLNGTHEIYIKSVQEFRDFLLRQNTEDCNQEIKVLDISFKTFNNRVADIRAKLNNIQNEPPCDSRSISSRSSSSRASEKRALVEAAKVRLAYAKKEIEMRKQIASLEAETAKRKVELDADLSLLKEEKEVAAAEAEASVYENEEEIEPLHYLTLNEIPKMNDQIMDTSTQNIFTQPKDSYIPRVGVQQPFCGNLIDFDCSGQNRHPTVAPPIGMPQTVNNTDILTSFLLRKDIMPKRLQKFNEKPQSFPVWKATFHSVMREMNVNAMEEMDLLVSHLGPESQLWAESLRASCAYNPERGLQLIWERLEHCYGSAEKIEASLKSRVDSFPQLTNKDNRKLFELSDLLFEIESVKANPKFAASFAVYDSSSGVNTIVAKLPYNIQQTWFTRAAKYKKDHLVLFPPFSFFVNFISEMSKIRNDPAFQLDSTTEISKSNEVRRKNTRVTSRKTGVTDSGSGQQSMTTSQSTLRCPIHNASHSLLECNAFSRKTMDERRTLLKEKGICFKCLLSSDHNAAKCPTIVVCEKCNMKNHQTVMHRDRLESPPAHGGEYENVSSRCTSLCDKDFKGRSCGKIVLVDVAFNGNTNTERVYAIIDDQSNRSLIAPELCVKLNVSGELSEYTLSSCSGSTVMAGRRVAGLTVTSIDGSVKFDLPTLIECDAIPQNVSEIPTKEVVTKFPHLSKLSSSIPSLKQDCGIHLLIGRDLAPAHHVLNQIIGPKNSPFAVQLPLGWVVIGEVCLGRIHMPTSVNTYFTHIDGSGRGSIFNPCESYLTVKDRDFAGEDVFRKTVFDNKVGLSADDRDFLKLMDQSFIKDVSGQWTAPLPFKPQRASLPNNREVAYKRAVLFKKSLEKNPQKSEHMVQFMEKIFMSEAAEMAPDNLDKHENWYLPLFGVYHPKKKDKIRGVFDSSVSYMGQSLNDQLLSGPNMTNSLLGVLLRFRRDKYAISADIEQMFYRFLVKTDHRDYLRFFWFQENNPELPLTEFRMRVHVFGNRPSPAVATYGLRKAVETASQDVQQFVARDFYVDDAMTSKPYRDEAISLLKKTKEALQENGQIHLHKIVSNDLYIMNQFPKEELDSSLKDLDLDDDLPAQRSLGLTWDINNDMFKFISPSSRTPFTRRGLLSAVNSIFDPAGFVAPFSITGKILLRAASPDGTSWDDPLPEAYTQNWLDWKETLQQLDGYQFPRMFIAESLTLSENVNIHVYSDASESAIAAAAYVVKRNGNTQQVGFIMGKAKLAPKSGHSIPRLELCAAVLATEIASFISEQLEIPQSSFMFFTDSKVVLGYIYNRTRRFYTYVSNRVAQIHAFSTSDQWHYISTELNPADTATRASHGNIRASLDKWKNGPSEISYDSTSTDYALLQPDDDHEIRPEIVVRLTNISESALFDLDKAEKFSSWKSLVSAYSMLIHITRTFSKSDSSKCPGWHICQESSSPILRKEVKTLILTELQKRHFAEEFHCLQDGKPLPKKSPILSLSPYIDEQGMLRVGGRLRNLPKDLGVASINPVIIPKGYIASLLVLHYHQQTFHQGRHITEGAIRSEGIWILGAKRLVTSVIHKCVTCRKLRGCLLQQKMADLPADRLSPGPPFSAVGVDVFGPWEIVTRKTRGGAANGKRWAVMFTCLASRAAHIEVIEDMSTSCFINALRRFTALRGQVRILRSDRGSNFIGAADCLKAHVIDVEDQSLRNYLNKNQMIWCFNAPHASHMGGVWERAIGVARRILDSMLLQNPQRNLTHEVLSTFMAEVTAIMNSRPIAAIEADSSDPLILSPNLILTQKQGEIPTISDNMGIKDCYRAQWKHVQVLSDIFWNKWRDGYLNQLQHRKKWQTECPNLKEGDVVLLREKTVCRNDWPLAVIEKAILSDDDLVRNVVVRCHKEGKVVTYTRPVCELVLLLSN